MVKILQFCLVKEHVKKQDNYLRINQFSYFKKCPVMYKIIGSMKFLEDKPNKTYVHGIVKNI